MVMEETIKSSAGWMFYVAASSALCLVVSVLYRLIRPFFGVRVKCWFCHKDVVVPFQEKNSWDCPQCDQYNGFTETGDYNKVIQEQYTESLNEPVIPRSEKKLVFDSTFDNGLCYTCNLNQQLKILQLAQFVPTSAEHYDEEVEQFKEHLERSYKLCRRCEAVLHQTLGKQNAKLQPQLKNWRQQHPPLSPASSVSSFASSVSSHLSDYAEEPRSVQAIHHSLLTLAVLMLPTLYLQLSNLMGGSLPRLVDHLPDTLASSLPLVYTYCSPLLLVCLGFNMAGLYILKKKGQVVIADLAACAPWIVILILQGSNAYISTRQMLAFQVVTCMFAIVCTLWCRLAHRPVENRPSLGITKKVPVFVEEKGWEDGNNSRPVSVCETEATEATIPKENEANTTPRTVKKDYLLKHQNLTPPKMSVKESDASQRTNPEQAYTEYRNSTPAKDTEMLTPSKSTRSKTRLFSCPQDGMDVDEEADSLRFGQLNLGNTPKKKPSNRSPFLLKPGLSRRSLLSPSKFSNSPSWVGGGFWDGCPTTKPVGFNPAPLSRSSSQSSGFYSMASNRTVPPNYMTTDWRPLFQKGAPHSLATDFDRASIFSEPPYHPVYGYGVPRWREPPPYDPFPTWEGYHGVPSGFRDNMSTYQEALSQCDFPQSARLNCSSRSSSRFSKSSHEESTGFFRTTLGKGAVAASLICNALLFGYFVASSYGVVQQ